MEQIIFIPELCKFRIITDILESAYSARKLCDNKVYEYAFDDVTLINLN